MKKQDDTQAKVNKAYIKAAKICRTLANEYMAKFEAQDNSFNLGQAFGAEGCTRKISALIKPIKSKEIP